MPERRKQENRTAREPGGSFGFPTKNTGRQTLSAAEERKLRNLARQKEKQRGLYRRAGIVLFTACLLAGLILLAYEAVREHRLGLADRRLGELLFGTENTQTEPEPERLTEDAKLSVEFVGSDNTDRFGRIQTIREMNPDFVGWIRVHCLYRIDLPVFQRDNAFYLNHDAAGEKSEDGSVFLDENSVLHPRDANIIVYAHNCASGERFGTLYQLSNPEYLSKDPLVTFGIVDERGEYKEEEYVPFAALRTTVGYRKKEFDFLVRSFADDASFRVFYQEAVGRSLIKDAVGCAFRDPLLTLVTCSDRAGESRFIVLLRKVREEEDPEELKRRFQSAE